jgi:lipopolysaccharide export system permease protein
MLFDSTLRRELARNFGATLVVIVTVVLTIMLIRILGQAALGRIAPQDVVLLLGYVSLGYLPLILSLSLFISVVATLGRLYRDSEMSIWFTSGAGLTRFVRPVLGTSWPVLTMVGLLALLVWPWENERGVELKDRFERRSDLSRVAPGQFQTSSDGRRVFFIERDAADGRTGRNVFILTQQPGAESVTSAHTGRIVVEGDQRFLVLSDGQRNDRNAATGEKGLSRFQSYSVAAGERILSTTADLPPKARATIELMRAPTAPNQGELVWRLGLLLGGANLVLLGIGLSASNPRHASNWNLLFALLSFVVYYNVINLTQAWVASGKVGMGLALGVTHGGAFLFALALLWWREHANSRLGWLRRGRRAPAGAAQAGSAAA